MADPPGVVYIYPAGGQRGTSVDVRVGAFDLTRKASFEILGPGVSAESPIHRTETIWLEGPVLQQPESVQVEDYPKDYSGRITIDAGASPSPRAWRVWNSEGASGSLPFIVGDLPEVVEVEREEAGTPLVVPVTLPVTVNGRIFPREDLDLWSFHADAGEVVSVRAEIARLGSLLEPWIEAIGPDGKTIKEVTRTGSGDPGLEFVATARGNHTIQIHDVGSMGSQRHLYRLSLTKGPRAMWVYPLGGRGGTSVSFIAEGLGVPAQPQSLTLPALEAGRSPQRSRLGFPGIGPATVEIDSLPEVLETEPNDSTDSAAKVSVPGVANGSIGRPGDVDLWRVPMSAGRYYKIDVRAARLGSSLDPLVSVTDRGGKELGSAEGTSEGQGDASLSVQAAESGVAFVRIRDRFRSRGGPASGYRLRLTEESPDFSLALESDTVTLTRESTFKLKVKVKRSGGFNGPIELVLDGFPEGIAAPKSVIDPKSDSVEIVLKAEKKAPIRSARLTVRGIGEVNGSRISRVAVCPESSRLPEIETVRLAVGLKNPFELTGPIDFSTSPRGTIHHHAFHLKAEPSVVGPIEVKIADKQIRHLQGITGPVLILPEGVKDFDYPLTLPPWMETGRTSRTVINTMAIVREPDGTEHEVSHSWPDNVHQFVTVVGPGLMNLQVPGEMIPVLPKRVAAVPVKLSRGRGVVGPVRVELVVPWSVRGLSAKPLTFSAEQSEGIMQLVCDTILESPRTAQLVLHATTTGPTLKDPVTAQTSLTILSESDPSASARH